MNSDLESTAPEGTSEESALAWALANGVAEDVVIEVGRRLRRRRQRRVALAGGTLTALLVAGILWQTRPVQPSTVAHPVNAVVSMPARRVLPDGSIVELKDGAQITFDYSGLLRRVTLQKGEAHFAVAKNRERPFVVDASGVEVRAVGTAFSVQFDRKSVEVLVTEGRVAVTHARAQPAVDDPQAVAPTFVDAGYRCVVALEQEVAGVPEVAGYTQAERDERLSWRVPRLEFSATPLVQALPMFNDYARVKLVIADPSLEGLELSGVLRADNTDSLLRLLEREFGIKAEPRGDEIVLSKGP